MATRSSAPVLDLRALNRATLDRQLLLARHTIAPLAAIERLAGMQAQWPRPPFTGLWTRLEGFAREDLLALLASRRAVRATLMRGTLHLASAADYLAWRSPLQPVLTGGMRALSERAKGIDPNAVIKETKAYLAAGPRTFDDIRDHLVLRFPKCNDRALGYTARMLVPLVMEPTDHAWGFPPVSRFALADDWLGKPVPASETVESLLLRYLAAFGPAGVADAQTWSGLQGLKPAFEALRSRLAVFRDERGRELFDLPKAPRPSADVEAPVRFLPEYDNVLLAHGDRRRIVADEHKKAVFLPALRVASTFLVDGMVAGTWALERKKKAAVLSLTPFGKLAPKDRRALTEEGERLARFAEPDAAEHGVTLGA